VADLGVTVVPLTVNFDDGSYRCGVDITSDQFYEKLESSRTLPTTSQPTPHDFLQTYEELSWETRNILSIHIASAMSGTVQSAQTAADGIAGVDVDVIDSRTVSAGLGMIVIEAARAAERGADLAELKMLVSNLSVRARIFFTVADLNYLVRGGRIGRARALLGKVAGVRPILTIEDGMVTAVEKARGDKGVLEALVELARPELDGGSGGMLGLIHACRPEAAAAARGAFIDAFGFDEVHLFELGGIVGTHVGPGTWGVSYFRRKPGR
jgi:DegV family protein with EDD domain